MILTHFRIQLNWHYKKKNCMVLRAIGIDWTFITNVLENLNGCMLVLTKVIWLLEKGQTKNR
jgi:hypothetical protein